MAVVKRFSELPRRPTTKFGAITGFVLRWVGVGYVLFLTTALFYCARIVAFPTVYPYEDSTTIDVLAFIIIFELLANLFVFNLKASENQVEHWQRHCVVASLCRAASEEDMEEGGEQDEERPEKEGRFCVDCNRPAPIRSHHCPICRLCVLRKDHHCFLTGACVGLGNQRYFIVFVFWGMIGCGVATWYIIGYMNEEVSPWYPWGWVSYIAPVALFRWFMGWTTFWTVFICVIFSFGLASCVACIGFFGSQMYYTLHGYTMFEYHSLSIREAYDGDGESAGERLRLVFGPYWAVNFVFPCVWWKQRLTPDIADNLFRVRSKQL